MLSGVGARHPERYRVTSKQRAENSNQDLT